MTRDTIYVEFEDKNEKPKSSSIIEGLADLENFGSLASKASGKVKIGGSKKEKKKKDKVETKSKKKKESMFDMDFSPLLDEDAEGEKSELISFDLDVEGLVAELYDQEGNLIDPMVEKERRSYKKRKKDKNPYKQEFAEELTILYDLYGNMNDVVKHLEKIVKQNDGSKVKGLSKYFNDAIMNLISARSTQLSIVKEMTSVKKTIVDLKFKEDAAKAKQGDGEESDLNLQAAALLQNIMGVDRGQYLDTVRGTRKPAFLVDAFTSEGEESESTYNKADYEDPEDREEQETESPLTIADIKDNYANYTEDDIDSINQLISRRIAEESGDVSTFRSPKGTAYIQYESRGAEVKIRRDVHTGDFDFIAVDRDNQVIYDYPLPENPGKIKFNGRIATDKFGNTYKVIEYSSEHDNQ